MYEVQGQGEPWKTIHSWLLTKRNKKKRVTYFRRIARRNENCRLVSFSPTKKDYIKKQFIVVLSENRSPHHFHENMHRTRHTTSTFNMTSSPPLLFLSSLLLFIFSIRLLYLLQFTVLLLKNIQDTKNLHKSQCSWVFQKKIVLFKNFPVKRPEWSDYTFTAIQATRT